mmetsp:Transcript_19087/g.39356  ORF Transcript_19087/g.39356 Transcript_19087/m.39356 type:complete len:180 (+) Transcript_19087:822-1361(+)
MALRRSRAEMGFTPSVTTAAAEVGGAAGEEAFKAGAAGEALEAGAAGGAEAAAPDAGLGDVELPNNKFATLPTIDGASFVGVGSGVGAVQLAPFVGNAVGALATALVTLVVAPGVGVAAADGAGGSIAGALATGAGKAPAFGTAGAFVTAGAAVGRGAAGAVVDALVVDMLPLAFRTSR